MAAVFSAGAFFAAVFLAGVERADDDVFFAEPFDDERVSDPSPDGSASPRNSASSARVSASSVLSSLSSERSSARSSALTRPSRLAVFSTSALIECCSDRAADLARALVIRPIPPTVSR